MMNTVRKSENLLPFPVISAAANGDTTAMCAILKHYEVYWSSFLVTLCSEIMLYIETPLVSYSYSLNEVSHSCTS